VSVEKNARCVSVERDSPLTARARGRIGVRLPDRRDGGNHAIIIIIIIIIIGGGGGKGRSGGGGGGGHGWCVIRSCWLRRCTVSVASCSPGIR
jgi:hypothetical protein